MNNNGKSTALSNIRSAIEICTGDKDELYSLENRNCANLLEEKAFNPNHSVITDLGTESKAIRTRLITGIRILLLDEKGGVSPSELASEPQPEVQKMAPGEMPAQEIVPLHSLIHSVVNLLSSENLLSEKIIARFVNDAKKEKPFPSWPAQLCEDLHAGQLKVPMPTNGDKNFTHENPGHTQQLHPLIKAFQKKGLIKQCSQGLYYTIKSDNELTPNNFFKQMFIRIMNAIRSIFSLPPFLAPLPNIDNKIQSIVSEGAPKLEAKPHRNSLRTRQSHPIRMIRICRYLNHKLKPHRNILTTC